MAIAPPLVKATESAPTNTQPLITQRHRSPAPRSSLGRRPGPAALVSRRVDVWLIGGASIAVLVALAVLSPLAGAVPSIDQQLRNLAATAPTLALIVNYPHFLASYRLAYWRRDAIVRHPFALFFVPVALCATTALSWGTFNATLTLGSSRIDAFGARVAGWAVAFMFLTVGWHYVKQSYGCARVGAQLADYPFNPQRARLLRYSMFPLWIAIWARSNATIGDFAYSGIRYGSLELPRWVVGATNIGIALGASIAAYTFIASWRSARKAPPALMTVPVIAMFVWWIPAIQNPTFIVLVPFFHSLQYLPFAVKVERGRIGRSNDVRIGNHRRFAITAAIVAIVGWIAFEVGPNVVDSATGSQQHTGTAFFFVMIPVAINIHHYFIDHVIWRRSEPEVFSHLVL